MGGDAAVAALLVGLGLLGDVALEVGGDRAGMSGISQATAGTPEQRDRLLDVLVDGLRRR